VDGVLEGGEERLPEMFGGSFVLHGAVAVSENHGLQQEKLLLAEPDVVESVQQYHALLIEHFQPAL